MRLVWARKGHIKALHIAWLCVLFSMILMGTTAQFDNFTSTYMMEPNYAMGKLMKELGQKIRSNPDWGSLPMKKLLENVINATEVAWEDDLGNTDYVPYVMESYMKTDSNNSLGDIFTLNDRFRPQERVLRRLLTKASETRREQFESLDEFHIVGGLLESLSVLDPDIAGMSCSDIGLNLRLPNDVIYYGSNGATPYDITGVSDIKCLWYVNMPEIANTVNFSLVVNTKEFTSNNPARLRIYSGGCDVNRKGDLYGYIQVGDVVQRGNRSVTIETLRSSFVFVPDNQLVIELEMDITGNHHAGASVQPSIAGVFIQNPSDTIEDSPTPKFLLNLEYFPIIHNMKDQIEIVRQDQDVVVDGVFQGYLTMSPERASVGAVLDELVLEYGPISGFDEGVYIVGNGNIQDLQGLQAIKTVNGPIVIRNNLQLSIPLEAVVDWLLALSGNITSVDLSFNRLTGKVPEEICTLIYNVTPLIDMSNNLGICGTIPSCLSEFLYANNESNIVAQVMAGNKLGQPCEDQQKPSMNSDQVVDDFAIYGCSPLDSKTSMETRKGNIVFDHMALAVERSCPPRCDWEVYMEDFDGGDSIILFEFNSFYTSVSSHRGSCSVLSSGHNFYSPYLNGPSESRLEIQLFDSISRNGYDMLWLAGAEIPPPVAIKSNKMLNTINLQLQTLRTWPLEPGIKFYPGDPLVQCGRTNISYSIIDPISDVEGLDKYVKEHLDRESMTLDGNVILSNCRPGNPLFNLSALQGVKYITGHLGVLDCYTLTSLSGLEHLERIGRSLFVQYNDQLDSLDEFGNLTQIGDSLVIQGNFKLQNFRGFHNLENVGGSMMIWETDVENLDGFQNLKEVEGQLVIQRNSNLKSLFGLNSLVQLGSTLTITYNYNLKSLDGLDALKHLEGSLDVQYNNEMTNISGLQALEVVRGSVGILNNLNLEEISSFRSLKTVSGSLVIATNRNLEAISLPTITSIGARKGEFVIDLPNHILAICDNPNLVNVSLHNTLEIIPVNLKIEGNSKLAGSLPTFLLEMDYVEYVSFSNNNFSGPISPSICKITERISYFTISHNSRLCGEMPPCPLAHMNSEGTGLGETCTNVLPPYCPEDENSCVVTTRNFSSNSQILTFTFPKFAVSTKKLDVRNINNQTAQVIRYRYAIGTKAGLDNVHPLSLMDENDLQMDGSNLSYDWNLFDTHTSMVNGDTYYVTIDAYEDNYAGVTSKNITSRGTLVDMIPPSISTAEVELTVDLNGSYAIKWEGFAAISGIDEYIISLERNDNDAIFREVPGTETSLTGDITSPDTVTGDTNFQATVVAVSNAGMTSPPVKSNTIWPLSDVKSDDKVPYYVIIIIAIVASIVTGAVVGSGVAWYLRRQKRIAEQKEFECKLDEAVNAFLHGHGHGHENESPLHSGHGFESRDKKTLKYNTFVFTDLVSSTKYCIENPVEYISLQEIHDEIVRSAIAQIGGCEVDTEGDSFQCAFDTVADGLNFCFLVQKELCNYDWPASVLNLFPACKGVKSTLYKGQYIWRGPKVRMAVHFASPGEFSVKTHPTTRRISFVGVAWDVGKTLVDVGHGGQIVVSESAWKELVTLGAEGAAGYPIFKDLGQYRIKYRDSMHMRILQASPSRSSLSERNFPELKHVTLLDQGLGLNTVSPPDGKVAMIALIMHGAYKENAHKFIAEISHYNQGENPCFVSNTFSAISDANESRKGLGSIRNVYKSGMSSFHVVDSIIKLLIAQFGGYNVISLEKVAVPEGCMVVAFKSPSAAARFALAAQTTLMEYAWPGEVLQNPSMKTVRGSKTHYPYFCGPRVAMSAHVEYAEILRFTGIKSAVGACVSYKCQGFVQALELAHIASGGQIVLSSSFFDSNWQKGLGLSRISITDLGVHDINFFLDPLDVIEVLPKVLEERSLSFPPLASQRILSAGARDAPGAHGESVAFVFTYPKVPLAFQKSKSAMKAVELFSQNARLLLSRYNGYESQEVGTGCFFLAFKSLDDAIVWSVHLQTILCLMDWNDSTDWASISCRSRSNTDHSNSIELESLSGKSEWNGSASDLHNRLSMDMDRIVSKQLKYYVLPQIGIVQGSPSKVCPHVQTGRADYFGADVNLTSRIASETNPGDIHVFSKEWTKGIKHCRMKHPLLPNAEPIAVEFRPCGKHAFKGFREKHAIYKVRVEGALQEYLRDSPGVSHEDLALEILPENSIAKVDERNNADDILYGTCTSPL